MIGVIIVLSVIALITVPVVTKVMNDSRKNSFKASAENLVEAANNYYADNQLSMDKTLTFNFALGGKTDTGIKLSYQGAHPTGGRLVLNMDGGVSLIDINNGKYYANYDSTGDDKVIVTETNEVLTRDELTQAIKDIRKDLNVKNTEVKEIKKELLAKDTEIINLKAENKKITDDLTNKLNITDASLVDNKNAVSGVENFLYNRFTEVEDLSYPYSCGDDNVAIRRMIEAYWERVPVKFSAKPFRTHGCQYTVYFNKTSNVWGTVILTGYTSTTIALGDNSNGKWRWFKTNMTEY